MSPLRLASALVSIGLIVTVPHVAEASSERAAVLPIQVEGDLNPEWQPKLEAALERGLTQGGVVVVNASAVSEATGGVTRCDNAKCYTFISSASDSRFLVVSRISVVDRNYEVELDIIDGRDGSLAASSSEGCQVCGLGEVEELVTKQAAALRQKVSALSLEPAQLAITSQPAQVRVFVDGNEIGKTPLEHELEPGKHEIEARSPGYIPQKRTVDAVRGVSEKLTFDLLPEDEPAPVGDEKASGLDWRVPTGWALLGVGVAAVAAGATFLAIDERPYKAQCEGPDVDAFGNCRQRYNTLVHGASFTAAGGVFVISGAAMLISARVRKGRRSDKNASRRDRALALLGGRF